jgi:hypothetical protein
MASACMVETVAAASTTSVAAVNLGFGFILSS